MDYAFQIVQLTAQFYHDYPHEKYPEILNKSNRAYNCFLFEIWEDIFVCVPYRTEIHHKYSYRFKNSVRAQQHKSGLDFSKAVIISNFNYISSASAVIDSDEFYETMKNITLIANKVFQYVKEYIDYNKGIHTISHQEYIRRYQYSPLQYFHKELNISV